MKAITPADLQEWLESEQYRDDNETAEDRAQEQAWWDAVGKQEQEAFDAMTATQKLGYLVHIGELAEICPKCGTRYVEVTFWDQPDMVGTTSGETYECCGHTDSANSALEYNQYGEAVDVR